MVGRYDAVGPEAEFQPGSRGRVLRNRLGIKSVRELEREESERLLATTQRTIDETRVDQRFTAGDVRQMHQRWLGEVYDWAGEYRGVNIAKGAFTFGAAAQVPRLVREFERGPLLEYSPCRFDTMAGQATALDETARREFGEEGSLFIPRAGAREDCRGFLPDLYYHLRPRKRETCMKPGRNDACPCGSGKKYKHCCMAPA